MLRAIVGTRRQLRDDDLEAWVDWVIRASREAECAMQKFGVPDWCEEIHRRRYRWAGHVARRQDGRWTREVLTWSVVGSRSQKRPLTRWSDTFRKFFCSLFDLDRTSDNSFWMDAAKTGTLGTHPSPSTLILCSASKFLFCIYYYTVNLLQSSTGERKYSCSAGPLAALLVAGCPFAARGLLGGAACGPCEE